MTQASAPDRIPPRTEIPVQYTWNHTSVYPSIAAWKAEVDRLRAELPTLSAFQGRLSQGAKTVLQALQTRDALADRLGRLNMYAGISQEVDKTDTQAAGLVGQVAGLVGEFRAAAAFIEPELLAIGADQIMRWLGEEPGAAIYKHALEDLFRKQAHVRSAEIEEVLGLVADPFSSVGNTAGMLTDADFQFADVVTPGGSTLPVSQGSLGTLLGSPDRDIRRQAWNHYHDQFYAHKYSLANNLATSIKQNVFTARVRRHTSTLEMALDEQNIPSVVFYNLIDTFKQNLPVWHRYFAARRKALGVDRLAPYDLWAPLTQERPHVPFEKAVDWITQGLAPLGDDYVAAIRRGCLEERWVDIYPNQGKTAGAFSYGVRGTHPFIVMSYNDTLLSMSTLAHELGHSMHSYLTWKTQPVVYSDYSLFVAETASNFHQAMVRAHLLQSNPDPAFQISVIEEAMSNFLRYFLIMPTLARFELETHQRVERGEGLTAEGMIDLMSELFSEAYGEEVEVDRQRVGMVWATFLHLYVDYYVFQYATGISAAHALSSRILKGQPGAVDNYRKFLSAGSSVYPIDALKIAGVDMSTPQAVEETFAVMAGLVERLEQLTSA